MVPFVASTGPLLSNWTGPTKLRLTVDGGGPKYERFTVAPTDGGAGNRLHPGPGPIGPGPGPCAVLGSTVKLSDVKSAARMSILPPNARRGARIRCESCAEAVMPKVMAITEAKAHREILRVFEALQFNGDSPRYS